jgi:hypothetical protein
MGFETNTSEMQAARNSRFENGYKSFGVPATGELMERQTGGN